MSKLIESALSQDWGLIIGTLMVRFVGVFVVLAVLMVGMIVLGKVVSKLVAMQESKKAEAEETDPHALALAEEPEHEAGEEELVAAIGAAIAMAMETEQRATTPAAAGGVVAGSWALAGRATQMDRRMQGGAYRP